jgi:hypothetical protein
MTSLGSRGSAAETLISTWFLKISATYYQMLKTTNFVFNCSVQSWVILFSFAALTYEIFASLYPE